ncbi:MAG: ATP-dependent Clp protease adaptor ClpS [Bacteroidetes bacterium]|nr:ATP-dependent Clp protease adaptor ClpS [Bacteroidota bacterium]
MAATQSDFGTKESTSHDVLVEVDTLWGVDLYNDEIHTFEEVISQLIKAISCSHGRAEDLAWTVHREGIAHVFDGEFEDCLRVSGVLGEIGLMTQIRG